MTEITINRCQVLGCRSDPDSDGFIPLTTIAKNDGVVLVRLCPEHKALI